MANAQPELLAGLAQNEAAALLALGTPVGRRAGEVLFQLGDPAECLYLVSRGRVALTLPIKINGREQDVFIEERLPGQIVGWSALIAPSRFTLKASVPLDTELIALPRQPLLDYLAGHPHVGYTVALNLAAAVGQRLQVVQAMWLREMQRVVDAHA